MEGDDRQKQHEQERHAKKQRRSKLTSSILQASQVFSLAMKEGPDYENVEKRDLL